MDRARSSEKHRRLGEAPISRMAGGLFFLASERRLSAAWWIRQRPAAGLCHFAIALAFDEPGNPGQIESVGMSHGFAVITGGVSGSERLRVDFNGGRLRHVPMMQRIQTPGNSTLRPPRVIAPPLN